MLHAIVSAFVGVAAFMGSLFGTPPAPAQSLPVEAPQNLGSALPSGTAVFETSLQSRISSTDTSLTLVSNSVRGGSSLSGFQCFTVDEGRTDAEYLCGTVSGTSVSGLTRGIDPSTGTTSNSALKFAHRVGADVKITDFPLLQILRNQANGADTYPNLLHYAAGVTPASGSDFTDKEYVDGVAFNGAGVIDASSIAKGVVELAAACEAASSTVSGGSGTLVVPAGLATSTYNSATAACKTVVTGNNGLIDQGFLPDTVTKTVTFASTTQLGSFRALDAGKNQLVYSTAGTYTFVIPSGVQKVFVEVLGPGGPGGSDSNTQVGARSASSTFSTFVTAGGGGSFNNADGNTGGGGIGAYCAGFVDVSATTSVQIVVGAASASDADANNVNSNGPAGGPGGICLGSATNLFKVESISGSDGFTDEATAKWGGRGANSPYGIGGSISPVAAIDDDRGFGSGGAGSGNDGQGATGRDGLVIVRW